MAVSPPVCCFYAAAAAAALTGHWDISRRTPFWPHTQPANEPTFALVVGHIDRSKFINVRPNSHRTGIGNGCWSRHSSKGRGLGPDPGSGSAPLQCPDQKAIMQVYF